MAEALDAEEMETYRWWINSQQDHKKFKWSSPDHAGTKAIYGNPVQQLLNLANNPKLGGKAIRGSGYEFAKATGAPIVYMDMKTRTFYNEQMKPIVYDPKKDRRSVVIPLREDGTTN